MTGELPPLVVAPRLERVRGALADAGCDALLVTHLPNVRWLTGFSGSSAQVLVLPDDALLVTDGRYREQAAAELASSGAPVEVCVAASLAAQRELVARRSAGTGRLGLEAASVSWADQRALAGVLDGHGGVELVPTGGVVEGLRAVKDDAEVARIEAAAAVVDAALAAVRPALVDGPTERDVALVLDDAIRAAGMTPGYDTIVASGPNSALPHHAPGTRRIAEGDLVVIDVGARCDGYTSDMTRTFVVGEPTAEQRRLLDVVRAAHDAGVAALRDGARGPDVDAAARQVVAAAGWAEAFVHPAGHGLGLEIHEPLRLAATVDHVLVAGNVVTVEPGVYLPGFGGVRVEDTVLVLADGARRLTRSPKQPVVR